MATKLQKMSGWNSWLRGMQKFRSKLTLDFCKAFKSRKLFLPSQSDLKSVCSKLTNTVNASYLEPFYPDERVKYGPKR